MLVGFAMELSPEAVTCRGYEADYPSTIQRPGAPINTRACISGAEVPSSRRLRQWMGAQRSFRLGSTFGTNLQYGIHNPQTSYVTNHC